jgi:prepilin-type N-terminal cleavage/methylation domain-containing protein
MSRGYSLIEIVLTMAIVSATAAVAIPSVSSWQGRHVTLREAKRVQRALERAYVMALLRETPVIVTLNSGGMFATTPDKVPLFSVTPAPGVSIQLKSKEQQALAFYPSHTATPTTILIVRSEFQCSVVLSLRGRARRECSW